MGRQAGKRAGGRLGTKVHAAVVHADMGTRRRRYVGEGWAGGRGRQDCWLACTTKDKKLGSQAAWQTLGSLAMRQ